MPVHHRRLAALIAALALVAPASAAAQSAGDDQYEDPFAGENRESEPAASPRQQEPAPAAEGGAGVPLAEPQLQRVPAATAAQPPAAAPASAELPYTGADGAPILIAGTVMLAAGVALRLRLREPR
jgi:hypothetical protein